MKDKKKYEAFMEELKKLANNFRDLVTELGDILAKILPDVEIPDEEEEDTWGMKCPYEDYDDIYVLDGAGEVDKDSWLGCEDDQNHFSQGNIFPTEEAAELESKRRNLLTRFRSFRDECNGDWKADFENPTEEKFSICFYYKEFRILTAYNANDFAMFGYFKNKKDTQRAIELFDDEIIELFVEGDA